MGDGSDNGGGDDQVSFDERGLPPIHHILVPDSMKITSTKIRWLHRCGYKVGEISNFLGVRYQQVRNVITTVPKRAAREDLAPIVIAVRPLIEDNLELMDQHAIEQEMLAQRREHQAERRATNRSRRKLREDETGNEALDDENYEQKDDDSGI